MAKSLLLVVVIVLTTVTACAGVGFSPQEQSLQTTAAVVQTKEVPTQQEKTVVLPSLEQPSGKLENLDVRFLSGRIEANLMPVVPPDPITGEIVLLMENKSASDALSGLEIPQADVFLDSTDQRLGTITFSTDWDGRLAPAEQDTVRLTKVMAQSSPFDPPCGKDVYLKLTVIDALNNSKSFTTNILSFDCSY